MIRRLNLHGQKDELINYESATRLNNMQPLKMIFSNKFNGKGNDEDVIVSG